MQTSPQIIIGLGTMNQAGDFFAVRGRLLVVVRGTAKDRWLTRLLKFLNVAGMSEDKIEIFSNFDLNPRVEEVKERAANLGDDFMGVLAFGGGSTIDTAKALVHYAGIKAQIFALPSIVGTGSEQTSFAALYQDGGKISLTAPNLLPARVLVDAELYRQSPPEVKNAPAIDCLCQAVESYWAKGATDLSRVYALECMRICSQHICSYVTTSSIDAAVGMGRASILSGQAINISKTTASHALSYGLSIFYGIKHGQAVALTLANLFEFNKYNIKDIDKMMSSLGLRDMNDFKPWFYNILQSIGLKTSISNFNIKNFDVCKVVDSVNIQRLTNNPLSPTRDQLVALFD